MSGRPACRWRSAMRFRLIAVAASLVTSLVVATCSFVGGPWIKMGSVEPGAGGAKPTVRVGSTNFSEQVILAEAYAQILEANGYPVERKLSLGNREIVEPALESSQIDLYPEYLATILAFVSKSEKKSFTAAAETQRLLQEALKPRGIAVLGFAPAVDTSGFVITRATADKLKLTRLSDL